MKNSKIHEGLENKEIRDFLSMSIVKSFATESSNKKVYVDYRDENFLVKNAEAEVAFWTKQLEICRERSAITTIIKNNGWNEFDVSDETENDIIEYRMKMNFIGTESEYDDLLKRIK